MRPRGHLTPAFDRHSLPGNRLLLHYESDEPARGAVFLDLAKRLRPGEVLVPRADPAEPGRDRVGIRTDVVSVERVADLQPERVASPETRRLRASLDDAVPQLARVVRRHHQLDAGLARIPGPVDHAGDAVDLALGERECRRFVEP